MQFSESWLRTFVDPDLNSAQLAHLLTMAGLEVEQIDPVAPPFTGVVVGQIVEVNPHPNADRLRVCSVAIGANAPLQIVCGAANARVGLKVACAQVGAQLPPNQTGVALEIKRSELRGVESSGMLCSASELQLSAESAGLLELPADAPVGIDLRRYLDLDDKRITIKLTPNKADCLSVLGVAREVAALTGSRLTMPVYAAVAANLAQTLPVNVSAPDLCGRFSGRVIRGVDASVATPLWLRQRLERSGQRSVSALVDISNYVMLELGQPTHIFDLDKLEGSLDVRWGRAGETLTLLNEQTVAIDDWVGVIADQRGPESLAGIMGGAAVAVSTATKNILVEAAFWWPQAIQGRARRYHFSSEAAHRFERGVDYATTVEQLERLTALIVEICGTPETAVGPIDDQIINLPQRLPVKLRSARAARVIGIALSDQQIAEIFTRLGLAFNQTAGEFLVTPPSYRFDIEIEEDLIEEIVRVIGFENIPALPPVAPAVICPVPENQRSLFTLRRQLADLDFQEVINFSFVDENWERDFADNLTPIKLLNPIAAQMSVLRSTLIGGLIANLRHNLNRKIQRVRLFEIAGVFERDASVIDGPLTVAGYRQPKRVAALCYGPAAEEQWGQPTRRADFFDLKADLEALFAPHELRFVSIAHPALHPGRSAQIWLDDMMIGVIGELHPRWQQRYELPHAPLLFEVDAAALQTRRLPAYQEVPRVPAVTRDLALVVKQHVTVQALLDTFQAQKTERIECRVLHSVTLFDEYRGQGLQPDEKSLAFKITLQDTQNTLQDELVDTVIAALIAAANQSHHAVLRS